GRPRREVGQVRQHHRQQQPEDAHGDRPRPQGVRAQLAEDRREGNRKAGEDDYLINLHPLQVGDDFRGTDEEDRVDQDEQGEPERRGGGGPRRGAPPPPGGGRTAGARGGSGGGAVRRSGSSGPT